MTVEIIQGDCLEVLRGLPAESVNCCVTSPPYWGQRDYVHPGQIGLETTPEIYIDRLVDVFNEVRRVLSADGTLWLNLADSYANDGKWGGETGGKQSYLSDSDRKRVGREKRVTGLKAKDMVGVPWRVAFGLQASGWWLRNDIIWNKPNGLCESVKDRCTKTHEYIFMLAKSERYYFDYKAIEEPCQSGPSDIKKMREKKDRLGGKHKDLDDPLAKASRSTNIGRKRAVGNGITRRSWVVMCVRPFQGSRPTGEAHLRRRRAVNNRATDKLWQHRLHHREGYAVLWLPCKTKAKADPRVGLIRSCQLRIRRWVR